MRMAPKPRAPSGRRNVNARAWLAPAASAPSPPAVESCRRSAVSSVSPVRVFTTSMRSRQLAVTGRLPVFVSSHRSTSCAPDSMVAGSRRRFATVRSGADATVIRAALFDSPVLVALDSKTLVPPSAVTMNSKRPSAPDAGHANVMWRSRPAPAAMSPSTAGSYAALPEKTTCPVETLRTWTASAKAFDTARVPVLSRRHDSVTDDPAAHAAGGSMARLPTTRSAYDASVVVMPTTDSLFDSAVRVAFCSASALSMSTPTTTSNAPVPRSPSGSVTSTCRAIETPGTSGPCPPPIVTGTRTFATISPVSELRTMTRSRQLASAATLPALRSDHEIVSTCPDSRVPAMVTPSATRSGPGCTATPPSGVGTASGAGVTLKRNVFVAVDERRPSSTSV